MFFALVISIKTHVYLRQKLTKRDILSCYQQVNRIIKYNNEALVYVVANFRCSRIDILQMRCVLHGNKQLKDETL